MELLADIQEIFEHQLMDRISSQDLVAQLCADEEKPWATYNRGQQITPRQIVGRLREFGIISNTIRIGAMTIKGYLKEQFTDAFNRYLADSLIVDVTPSQTNDEADFIVTDLLPVSDKEVTGNNGVTGNMSVIKDCDVVTDKSERVGQ